MRAYAPVWWFAVVGLVIAVASSFRDQGPVVHGAVFVAAVCWFVVGARMVRGASA